jgi:CTP:molybdopterin cytidylyltransferase MocA
VKIDPVAAVILAAGASTRLGSPKQLIRLGSETLLERTVRIAFEAGLKPIYGVVSPNIPSDAFSHPMIRVLNVEAHEGIASSIRAGLRAVQNGESSLSGIVMLTCDQPAVTAKHLRELACGGDQVFGSAYAQRKGVPAYFPARAFAQLLNLRGDVGARDFLKTAAAIDLPGGELDIDTPEDLERALKLYGT